jgi:hypothetical protein
MTRHIRHILAHGTAQERNRLYEALIVHIEITSDDTILSRSTESPRPATPTDPSSTDPDPIRGADSTVRALASTSGSGSPPQRGRLRRARTFISRAAPHQKISYLHH